MLRSQNLCFMKTQEHFLLHSLLCAQKRGCGVEHGLKTSNQIAQMQVAQAACLAQGCCNMDLSHGAPRSVNPRCAQAIKGLHKMCMDDSRTCDLLRVGCDSLLEDVDPRLQIRGCAGLPRGGSVASVQSHQH